MSSWVNYCYANASKEVANKNYQRYLIDCDSIVRVK